VIVGVGQLRANRGRTVEAAREPLALLVEALGQAGAPDVLAQADAVYAVKVASWAYDDLAATVGAAVGATPRTCVDTDLGGHLPVRLLDQAAARIWAGDSEIALVVGAEAQASVTLLGKAGIDPVSAGWTAGPGGPPAFHLDDLGTPSMQAAELLTPTRVYPLYENRLQADLGLTPAEALRWSAELYADLSVVAARQPATWSTDPQTAEEIGTVTDANRIVCEPYPLAMNAMPHVDQAAALLVMSHSRAVDLGLRDLVHVWGGAGADDDPDVLARQGFGGSKALESTLDRCLDLTGGTLPDLVDVYSCFPVVPKLAALHLGLPRRALLSVTGGHSSFGGPLNSYSLHALATMTALLRAGGTGLVHANGGYLTYQHGIVLSGTPHPDGYVGSPVPQAISHRDAPALGALGDQPVEVETATVEHGRDGSPRRGFLVARDSDGRRVAHCTAGPDAGVLSLSALPAGVTTHVGRRLVRRDGELHFLT
jgi:acetyl-CoA C-acetyltransferase